VTGIRGTEAMGFRQGRAGPALGIAAFGSFIAGTLGVAGLMVALPSPGSHYSSVPLNIPVCSFLG
jgi:putative tricarboxylic transport membrane protein